MSIKVVKWSTWWKEYRCVYVSFGFESERPLRKYHDFTITCGLIPHELQLHTSAASTTLCCSLTTNRLPFVGRAPSAKPQWGELCLQVVYQCPFPRPGPCLIFADLTRLGTHHATRILTKLVKHRPGPSRVRRHHANFGKLDRCARERQLEFGLLLSSPADGRRASSTMPPNQILPGPRDSAASVRMQYRSLPVSVAVDPVSLVISECVSITTEIRKRIPSPNTTVSAILGNNPNTALGDSNVGAGIWKPNAGGTSDHESSQTGLANRWGLRGSRGMSIQDNPLISSFGKLRYDLSGTKGWIYWHTTLP